MSEDLKAKMKRLQEGWGRGASDAGKASVDAMLDHVRSTGTEHAGQSRTVDEAHRRQAKRRVDEAYRFQQDAHAWFMGEIQTGGYSRWQGYFAASLLVVNLRQGCTEGTAVFDQAAGGAQVFFDQSHRVEHGKVPDGWKAPDPSDVDVQRGAQFAQNLIDWFQNAVVIDGIDRWQGYFAAALLTIELRMSCPDAEGGVQLFDAASEAAWTYYDAAMT